MVSSSPSLYQTVSQYHTQTRCTLVHEAALVSVSLATSLCFSLFLSFSSPVSVAVGQCGYLGQRGEWETHC